MVWLKSIGLAVISYFGLEFYKEHHRHVEAVYAMGIKPSASKSDDNIKRTRTRTQANGINNGRTIKTASSTY